MNETFPIDDQLFYEGQVYLTPVKCVDGKYRWCVASFEDIKEDTPAFISHDYDPFKLFCATDKSENPELYEEN